MWLVSIDPCRNVHVAPSGEIAVMIVRVFPFLPVLPAPTKRCPSNCRQFHIWKPAGMEETGLLIHVSASVLVKTAALLGKMKRPLPKRGLYSGELGPPMETSDHDAPLFLLTQTFPR